MEHLIAYACIWVAAGALGWLNTMQRWNCGWRWYDMAMLPVSMFIGPLALLLSICKAQESQ